MSANGPNPPIPYRQFRNRIGAMTTTPSTGPHITSSEESVLKVRATTSASSVAGAISQALYDSEDVKLRAIGAGAVNQAVKACAIARSFVASRGIDLCFIPFFETQPGREGQEISVMAFRVRPY